MNNEQDLSLRQKLFYGIGEIANTIGGTIIGFLYVFYLTNVMGMSAWLAGFVYFLGAVWDAVTDPVAGYLSDITRSKFGRRRVYFLTTALPFAVLFFAIWAVPKGWSEGAMFAYSVVMYLLYRTASTLFIVPYNTYGMEIIKSYDGRTSLQSYRYFFSILFGLVAAALPEIITTLPLDPSVPEGMPTSLGYILMAACFAVPILISPLFTFAACKEAPYNNDPKSNFIAKIKATFKNRHFLKALGMYICSWVTIGTVQALLLYYLGVLGRSDDFAIVAAIIMGTATISLPAWVWISKKLDKRKALMLGFIISGCALALLMLPPAFVNAVIWVLLPIIGFGISSMHMIPSALLPEAIEAGDGRDDERPSDGVYFGVVTFSEKIGTACIIQIAMLALQLCGFISTQEGQVVTQPQMALDCIRIVMGLLPVILIVVGLCIAHRFTIGRENAAIIRNVENKEN
ncbi:MAG: hypothetical protein DBX46_04190 [Clostridiales bacterium]|nr:MAG: hypothetical protein DBX46_04190 [Clostridiales bacterium]